MNYKKNSLFTMIFLWKQPYILPQKLSKMTVNLLASKLREIVLVAKNGYKQITTQPTKCYFSPVLLPVNQRSKNEMPKHSPLQNTTTKKQWQSKSQPISQNY